MATAFKESIQPFGRCRFARGLKFREEDVFLQICDCRPLMILCCTSLLFQVTVAVATDFNLQSRKNVDHNLDCRLSPFPPEHDWPALGPPRSSFLDLVQLCGRVADRPNVGCLCDTPYTDVECPNTGTISLVTNQVLWHQYHEYCRRYCRCANRQNRFSNFDEAFAREMAAGLGSVRQSSRAVGQPVVVVSHVVPGVDRPEQIGTNRPFSRSLDALQEGMCGRNCSTITQQCSSGSTGQCKCAAQPIGGVRDSIVRFAGACAPVHSVPKRINPIGDKQVPDGSSTSVMVADDTAGFFAANGERVACPCNATYVSYGCCGSETGIVWETPDKKLGELKASA